MFKKSCFSIVTLVVIFFGLFPARSDAIEESSIHDQRIPFCISLFRDGYYQKAIDCLNDLMVTLHNKSDTVEALKYLGFCYGMLNRIDFAKDCFNSAMEKDPKMEIDTLEFPPNITLICNQIKLERKLQKLDTITPVERKNPIIPVLILGGGLVTAVPGGYFLMHAKDLYAVYQKTAPPQSDIDKAYGSFRNALIKGYIFSGFSAILLPVSIYLLLHHEKGPGKKIGLMVGQDRFVFTWAF
jgi:tetratricopeptide (TPR) repeat protein